MDEKQEVEGLIGPGLLALLRGPVVGIPDLRAPMDKVCPACGLKHTGPFQACSSCKSELDRGE